MAEATEMKRLILHVTIVMLITPLAAALRADWERTNGPGAGWVRDIAIDSFSTGHMIYASTRQGGIFRSTNLGANWLPCGQELLEYGSYDVYSLMTANTLVFASLPGAGVLRSTDFGATWEQANNGFAGYGDSSRVFAFAYDGQYIYAGDSGGMFRSADSGETWIQVNSGLDQTEVTCLCVGTGVASAIYASIDGSGVYRSTDHGDSWTRGYLGLGSYSITALTMVGTVLYAGTYMSGVYQSVDSGQHWTALNAGLDSTFSREITVLAGGGGRLFAGTRGAGVFTMSIGVSDWVPCNDSLLVGGSLFVVDALAVDGETIFAGTHGSGIYSTILPDDATEPLPGWQLASTGLSADATFELLEVGQHMGNYHYLLAGSGASGVFVSGDSGRTWGQPGSALKARQVVSLAANATTLFAGTWPSDIYRSSGAAHWEKVSSQTGVTAMCVGRGNIIASNNDGRVVLSTNNGLNWFQGGNGLPSSVSSAHDLAVMDTIVYISNGYYPLYRSTDGGVNWQSVGSPPGTYTNGCLAVSDNNLYLNTASSGVFRTSDGGANWIACNNGLPGTYVLDLLAVPPFVFAATFRGVYMTLNQGANWSAVNAGLPFRDVRSLAAFDGYLFAGVNEGGVWRRLLSEMQYSPGDADGNATINISDAVYLISYIFIGGSPPDPLLNGDADCTGIISISDAVYLISYIFAGGGAPGAACK